MYAKPLVPTPTTPPAPARGACPADGRPKRCARGICRRKRACAHPRPPGTLDTAAGPVGMHAHYREFVSLVLSLVDAKGNNPLEIVRAAEAAKARRRRKAARRAERAGRTGPSEAGAAPHRDV